MTEIAAKNAILAAARKIGADVQGEEDGEQVLYIEFADGTCWCGCHQPTNENSNFRQGHDMKLVSKLLLAARNDLSVALTSGGLMSTMSAEVAATKFGGAFPTKLANRAAKAKTPKAKREKGAGKAIAASQNPAAKADPNAPRAARCKVGRWTYDGTIEEGEFYYTNKQDKVVYVAKGKYTEV